MTVSQLLEEADIGQVMDTPLPALRKRPPPPKSLGRPEFDSKGLAEFQSKPPEKQKEELKTSWAEAAYILAERLKRFAMTVSRKDFGRLQQLATSAGVAYDKVIPKGMEQPNLAVHGNVMFNLFGSLGADKVMRILTPTVAPIKEIVDGCGSEGRQDHGEDAS